MNPCLTFDAPGSCFEESILLGNGFLGAAVYGGTAHERYSMNEATLWSGFPQEAHNPKAQEALKRAQKLIGEGKYCEAAETLSVQFTGEFSQSYLPLCTIYIDYGIEEYDTYSRTLDMEKGICKVSYTKGNQSVSRESFISNPDRVMVIKIRQTGVPLTQIYMESTLQGCVFTASDRLILRGTAPYFNRPVGRGLAPGKKHPHAYFEDDSKKGMRYKGVLKIESNGAFRLNGDIIELLDATETTIYFAARTSFNGFDKHPYLNGAEYENICDEDIQKAVKQGYDALKSAHIADFSALFGRTSFTLCNSQAALPTDRLLKEHKSNALYELLFHMGKYLTISASRKGGQPMNLQGIWNELCAPPWNSNYTININTEMNYLPTLPLNLPECFEPYVKFAKELAVNGRKIAEEWYGVQGVISHHNTDIWRMAHPVGRKIKSTSAHSFYNTSFGWILWGLCEKFRLEQDVDYLKDTLYPLLTTCAETYIRLFTEDENGYYYLSPANSPENRFLLDDGSSVGLAPYSTINNTICRDILHSAAEFSALLGKTDAADRYQKYADRVMPYQISDDGRILEWDQDYKEIEPTHRHVSHLYGLHPAREITPFGNPDLASAAKKSLDVRGDEGTGWCIAWKANMWARLFDGNRALKLLDNQLSLVEPYRESGLQGGTYPNMLCAHPPFQIDGNFGAAAAIIEMLVQCDGKNIYILPALPDKWQSGEIKGICIAGGAHIDIAWENGKATRVKITPEQKAKDYRLIDKTAE